MRWHRKTTPSARLKRWALHFSSCMMRVSCSSVVNVLSMNVSGCLLSSWSFKGMIRCRSRFFCTSKRSAVRSATCFVRTSWRAWWSCLVERMCWGWRRKTKVLLKTTSSGLSNLDWVFSCNQRRVCAYEAGPKTRSDKCYECENKI